MSHNLQFYIDGAWVDPVTPNPFDVIDPSTEEAFAQISLGSKADVDKAVAAAKRGLPDLRFQTEVEERLELLQRILDDLQEALASDIAQAVSREMGAPRQLALEAARSASAWPISTQIVETLEELRVPSRPSGTTLVVKEPIGVVGADHAVELAAQPDRLQGRRRRSPPAAPWC